jgi:putative phage-type endonuclease
MTVEKVVPKDKQAWLELRTKYVTSTEISALFGLSPYLTEFELWHKKKSGQVPVIEPSERMKWGTRLQETIAGGIAEDNGWPLRLMNEFVFDDSIRAGSSFDYAIQNDNGILEIKNVDALAFKDGWIVDGDFVEAPPHIELQVQYQLMLSCAEFAFIGALIGGNKVVLLERKPKLDIFAKIKERLAKFWASIDADQEPKPDFKRDAEFIASLYNTAIKGKILDAKENKEFKPLTDMHKILSDQIKDLEEEKEAIKAQLLVLMIDNEKVIGDGFSISAGVTPETFVEAYTRKGFRSVRIFLKKEK